MEIIVKRNEKRHPWDDSFVVWGCKGDGQSLNLGEWDDQASYDRVERILREIVTALGAKFSVVE